MRRLMHRLATVVTVAVMVPHALTAQPDHWEATAGPPGGLVNALIIDNGTVFVGSDLGGIFRSDDLGDSWTRLDATGVFEGVNDFVKNGQGQLFAATDFGVRRSTDGGTTWDLFADGLTGNPYIVSIAVNSSDVLFAGSSISGMFRSENNGENWTEINSGLTSKSVQALAVGINDTVYVGTNDGLFESADNGDSWTDITGGLPYRSIWSLLAQNDGTLWAGSYGVFKRTAGGWTKLDYRTTLDLDTLSTGAVIAGMQETVGVTTDGGATWLEPPLDPTLYVSVYAVASQGDTILAGTFPEGIFRSDDTGASWHVANDGFVATEITDLAATSSGRLIASTRGGPFYSDDLGATWVRGIDGLDYPNLESLGVLSDGTVLAGTNNDGIYYSTDSGQTWASVDSNLVQVGIKSFAEAPNGDLYAGGTNGVTYRSRNHGASWDSVDAVTSYYNLALGVAPNGTVYSGSRAGIHRSTDGGTTWEDASNGLPDSPDVVEFLFESNGDILAAAFQGVFRSTDEGDSWTETGTPPIGGLEALAQDAEGRLYIAIRGDGVATSNDQGATWSSVNAGLNNLDATSLAVVAGTSKWSGFSTADQVFVGTRGGGVSRLVSLTTAIEAESPSGTSVVRLGSNYPNPFRESTSVPIEIEHAANATLTVFDILGREVLRNDKLLPAGRSEVVLDTHDLAPGVYVYRVDVNGRRVSRTMMKD